MSDAVRGAMGQLKLFDIYSNVNESDIHYTPRGISSQIVSWANPKGVCLDPFRGDGSFYDFLPQPKLWCELQEGKDFFQFGGYVDWIISNPPYSIFCDVLKHSFEVSENVIYLTFMQKFFSHKIMRLTESWGGIKRILVVGGGNKIGFSCGFVTAAFHLKKGYKGSADLTLLSENNTSTRRNYV